MIQRMGQENNFEVVISDDSKEYYTKDKLKQFRVVIHLLTTGEIFDKDENYVAAIGKANDLKPRDVAVSKDKIGEAPRETRLLARPAGVNAFVLIGVPSAIMPFFATG